MFELATNHMTKFIGIDLGGTGVRLVVTDEDHKILQYSKISTKKFNAPTQRQSISMLQKWIEECVSDFKGIDAVGIGSTGPVDLITGIIHNPDTLPQFSGTDLAGDLSALLNCEVWIDNDANAAGIAESVLGSGKDFRSVLCVTIGTGIGVALINNGLPIRALDGQHPEGGHIRVSNIHAPCYCGLDSCWEMSASRLALERLARKQLEIGDIEAHLDYSRISPDTWREFGRRIADGLITHLVISRPELVVVCGSIIEQWHLFDSHVIDRLNSFRGFGETREVRPSHFGDLSGAIGATLMARNKIGIGKFPT
jgi:glucokinase